MAGRSGIVRQPEGRVMSDAEIMNMGVAAALLPAVNTDEDGLATMTEAEVRLLEAKGLSVAVSDSDGRFEAGDASTIDHGATLFKIGSGDNEFSGKVIHKTGNNEYVYLWHRVTGQRRSLPVAYLAYLVTPPKPWLPRPPEGVEAHAPNIPCPARLPHAGLGAMCKKKFLSPVDAADHFRKAHGREYQEAERMREIERSNRMDSLLDSLATNGEVNSNAGLLAVLLELSENMKRMQRPVAEEASEE